MTTVADPVAGRYGLRLTRTEALAVRVDVPGTGLTVDDRGRLRLSALVAAADVAAGVSTGYAAAPRWTLTADIDLHRADVACRDGAAVVGEVAMHGRRLLLARVHATASGGPASGGRRGNPSDLDPTQGFVAAGSVNHVHLAPSVEPVYRSLEIGHGVDFAATPTTASTPSDAFGLCHVERADGRVAVQITLTPETANFYGFLHGAMTGVLVEELAGRELDLVEDLNMRFMRSVTQGPAEATVVDRIVSGRRAVLIIEVVDSSTGVVATRAFASGPIRSRGTGGPSHA
ncbi:PaaI family thioesterase [Micromonospora sp. HUAS LYJ1]|uniref:PaaI family thioesterase n=1 Tax=Micromonospora sp. HUAS LYJ1 TaxID=3061626 RepID=UPI002673F166|nr:hypothetical protein [Micromonospora sp. HUAS LYJ1]WKU03541.1 hypothetical protein Q2K16_22205 [Micromonospora sp. HUAS LYJ1]